MQIKLFFKIGAGILTNQARQISSSTTSITKIKRPIYMRTYPTVVVSPNGASINVRYNEPRKIIKVWVFS